jgi:hypothetical protein
MANDKITMLKLKRMLQLLDAGDKLHFRDGKNGVWIEVVVLCVSLRSGTSINCYFFEFGKRYAVALTLTPAPY